MVGDARHFGEEVDVSTSPIAKVSDGPQGSDAWLASELSGIECSAALVRLIQNVCEGTRDLLTALEDLRPAKLETDITHSRWGNVLQRSARRPDRAKTKARGGNWHAKDLSPENRAHANVTDAQRNQDGH
jgi:hypothetical protein